MSVAPPAHWVPPGGLHGAPAMGLQETATRTVARAKSARIAGWDTAAAQRLHVAFVLTSLASLQESPPEEA